MKKRKIELFVLLLMLFLPFPAKTQVHVVDSILDQIVFKQPSPFAWGDFNYDLDFPFTKEEGQLVLVSTEDHPLILYSQGKNISFTQIFLAPHDTVYISLKVSDEKKYSIDMQESDNMNTTFINSFSSSFPYKNRPRYDQSQLSNLDEYKLAASKWLENKSIFLEKAKSDKLLSPSLYDYYSLDIVFDYYNLLYRPIWEKGVSIDTLPPGYLDNLPATPATPILTSSYRSFLIDKNIFNKHVDYKNDTKRVFSTITHNYSGQERAFLVSYFIGLIAKTKDNIYKEVFADLLAKSTDYVTDESYISYIERASAYYTQESDFFPDNILESTYLTSYNNPLDSISLGALLKQYEDKPIYLDFWASWCGPCRNDIQNSSKTKKVLQDKNIEVLYFSIDEDEKSWIKASLDEGITNNQYLVRNIKQSKLYEFLKLQTLPRGVILDSKHRILSFKAPRLHDEFISDLNNTIKEVKKVEIITFF